MNLEGSFEACIGDDDTPVIVEYEGYYERAKTWGLPENCYPADAQLDIVVTYADTGNPVLTLTRAQEDRLKEEAWERAMEVAE